MAVSKEKKGQQLADYKTLVEKSQALIIARYGGLNMPQLDKARKLIREAQGEFHVTKNTLLKQVLEEHGMSVPDAWLKGATGIAFAFKDPTAVAKAIGDLDKEYEKFSTVGGVVSGQSVDAAGVKELASLPSLDVLRAQLLGMLDAPASGIVGALNAAIGAVAYALQAKVDKEQPAEAAA